MNFHKYQGTGNDFVMVDNRTQVIDSKNSDHIRKLCNRRFGIGSDGLILLQDHAKYDFEMLYFNADGKPGTMCGNGGRCIAHFASTLELCQDTCTFGFNNSVHKAYIRGDSVKLKMQDVNGSSICHNSTHQDFFMDTGSPHYVRFVSSLNNFPVVKTGREIRYQERFAAIGGINVNFVQLGKPIRMRTFERGVEAETLSCGTGAVAVAIASVAHNFKVPLQIETAGGMLTVDFKKTLQVYKDVYIQGSVKHVFQGKYDD